MTLKVVAVRSNLVPDWKRHPIRWLRFRRWMKEAQAELDASPLARQVMEAEERAFLFGEDKR